MRLSERFRNRLTALAQACPEKVSGPFGLGAMVAFTAMNGNHAKAASLLQALFQAGVIGFIAGTEKARLRFLLPLGSITEQDIDSACDVIDATIRSFPD